MALTEDPMEIYQTTELQYFQYYILLFHVNKEWGKKS